MGLTAWSACGVVVRWCKGSTEVFGAFSRGSNPRRTANRILRGYAKELQVPGVARICSRCSAHACHTTPLPGEKPLSPLRYCCNPDTQTNHSGSTGRVSVRLWLVPCRKNTGSRLARLASHGSRRHSTSSSRVSRARIIAWPGRCSSSSPMTDRLTRSTCSWSVRTEHFWWKSRVAQARSPATNSPGSGSTRDVATRSTTRCFCSTASASG